MSYHVDREKTLNVYADSNTIILSAGSNKIYILTFVEV